MNADRPSEAVKLVLGLTLLLGGPAACGESPAEDVTPASPSSIDSALAVAGRAVPPEYINRYVAERVGFTSRGGQMRCAYLPLGATSDRLFVNTLCLELVREGDSLSVGSGRGGPVALRVEVRGDSARILSHEVPADGGHAASIRRIFPPDVARRILAPTAVHNADVGRLEYYLRGEAAARHGLRP